MTEGPHERIGNFQIRPLAGRIRAVPWRMIAAVVIAFLVLAGYLGVSQFIAWHRRVYVVNGSKTPSDVRINGDIHRLPPEGRIEIRLAEGDVTIHRLGDPDVATDTVRLATSAWTRPFLKHTFILNPDRAAVIVREQIGYYRPEDRSGEDELWEQEFHAGELLYDFTGIDFEFREFPKEISLGQSKQASRRRIDLDTDWDGRSLFRMMTAEHGTDAALAQLRNALRVGPDDRDRLELLRSHAGNDALLEFVRPLLDREPLLMEVHRACQDVLLATEPRSRVIEEYRRRLADRPDDHRRQYLLARVILDTDPESEALMKQAADSMEAAKYARHSLVLRYMSAARFADAVTAAAHLRELDSTDTHYMFHVYEALWAAGRIEDALQIVDESAKQQKGNGEVVLLQAIMLSQLERDAEAQEKVRAFEMTLANDSPPELTIEAWHRYFQEMLAYVHGDAGPLAAVSSSDGSFELIQSAVAAGDLDRVDRAAAYEDEFDDSARINNRLLAAIVMQHAGDSERAAKWLDRAAEFFEELPTDEHQDIAAWLRGREAPDSSRLLATIFHTKTKLLLLVVLGQRHPEVREPLFTVARKLNFDRRPPCLLIRDVLQ